MEQLTISPAPQEFSNETLTLLRDCITDNKERQQVLIAIKYRQFGCMGPLKFIIDEICDCLLTNKYVAATTATNLLFENALKLALILYDSEGRTIDDEGVSFEGMYEDEVKDFIDEYLSVNINKAFQKGLIEENLKDKLHNLRKEFRNPFSHGSLNNALKGATTTIAVSNISDVSNIEYKHVPIAHQPLLYYMGVHEFLKREALHYFYEIYCLVDFLEKKLEILYQ